MLMNEQRPLPLIVRVPGLNMLPPGSPEEVIALHCVEAVFSHSPIEGILDELIEGNFFELVEYGNGQYQEIPPCQCEYTLDVCDPCKAAAKLHANFYDLAVVMASTSVTLYRENYDYFSSYIQAGSSVMVTRIGPDAVQLTHQNLQHPTQPRSDIGRGLLTPQMW